MNTTVSKTDASANVIPMGSADPVEVKRIAIRLALISLALLGMLAWNGLLIFMVVRMIQLW
jgi:hypothetical protein